MSVIPQAITHDIEIFGRKIGNRDMSGHRCLIIAELGINHGGCVARAEEMVRAAADVGVDVVKLQRRHLSDTYTPAAFSDPNKVAHGLAHYLPVLKETQLPNAAYEKLQRLADVLGVGFLVTPFDENSVDFLQALGVSAFKTASSDFDNPFLHKKISETKKPVIVSTGMQDEMTVWTVMPELKRLYPGRFALMHAVSSYPTAFRDCQLHSILRLKINHRVPVGWSGHERGVSVSVAAAALGADIIERHFTMDRTLPGPDQAASLEPDGLKKLVERIRAAEEAYGDPFGTKGMTRGELQTKEILGKSLCARRDIKAGQTIVWEDLEARSPGRGLSPFSAHDVIRCGKVAIRDIAAGTLFVKQDFAPKPSQVGAAS